MDQILAAKAHGMGIPEGLAEVWPLILKAIEVGWLDHDDLLELVQALSTEGFGGYGVLEFSVEPKWGSEGDMQVSFLDERYDCPRNLLTKQLESLLLA